MPPLETPLQQPWELHIIKTAVQQGDLMADEGLAIAMVSLREVLFAIISSSEISWNWQSQTPVISASELGLNLDQDKVEAILDETIRLHRQWTSLGLDLNHVNNAPVLQDRPKESTHKLSSFSSVHELLKGTHSFWDLALISPMPLAVTTRLLHHFLQQGILLFQFLPDLMPPAYLLKHLNTSPVLVAPEAPLIACIDDSPQVCHLMEMIVTGAGYRFLGITDSLKALPELMEKKPQFIFLDLVMPVVGGYELCKQLRRVKAFELTPITILTGRNGMIPRLKSNMVGATHFVNKPLDPDLLLALLNQHFGEAQGEVSALTEMAVETAIEVERVSSQTHVA
ncbi:MAG: response regulator [Oscillatoriales cyanobacterium]|nr:MAG: response regulator [Oscillatoriales cyanobacterium]